MSLTANTATTAAAVDTTVITKRYSGELVTTSGTTNLTLYTCPADKIAYVYFQTLYMTTTTNGKWHFYIGNNSITQSTRFPGTIFYYENTSSTQVHAKRFINDEFIVTSTGALPISVGFAINNTPSVNLQIYADPLYSLEYARAYQWSTTGTNSISQILPSRIIINPNNQLKYTHVDQSQKNGFWDFLVEEHAYVAPT
jgi:hypothetical protein